MSGALNSVFGGGNIFGALLSVASIAFPPLALAGGLSNLLTTAIGEAVKMAATTLAQEFGMPKFLTSLIGQVVDSVVGQLTKQSDPAVDSHLKETAGSAVDDFKNDLSKSIVDNAVQNIKSTKKKGSGSWLEALAEALGKALDAQAAKVQQLSSEITDQNAKDKPSTMTELQTASQRLSFMMNSADQAIKTIGEALSTAARKQ
ncbi:hypothetical protein [Piscinibacter terrae]|uniref:hypothetical protein n=1 Tax=Piscinibacter terrae TaxID=2496871 RepID=UPI000F5B7BF8|nr:hypothetical protein [Albitalea terrae]